jgi:predicted O-methyltransferase YrrM
MNVRIKKIIQHLKNEGPFLFFRKRFKHHILGFFLAPFYFIRIKRNQNISITDALNFVFNDSQQYFLPLQVKSEITELANLVEKRNPKIVMEIGTALGGTLFLLSKATSRNTIFISLDLPGGRFGGGYPWWKILLYKAFKKKNQKIFLVRKNSHLVETVNVIEKILAGEKIDFLFIDGDHTYEGVKRDFELYSPLVRSGGMIGFHDILPVDSEAYPDCKVDLFWNEIKLKYQYQEFVENEKQNWAGIGVITLE